MPDASLMAYLATVGFLSLILCYLAPLIGGALGLMDDPRAKAHSLHASPTPLVGGLPAILALALAGADELLARLYAGGEAASPQIAPVALLALAVALVGVADDRRHLSARLRLTIMAPMFTVFMLLNPAFSVESLTSPALGVTVPLGALAAPFSALCLVAFTNAVNMADGRNGLVIGLSLIWSLALSAYLPADLQTPVFGVAISLLVAGYFNLRGRLFLGDSGTYSLSALIGLLGLYAHGLSPEAGGISSTQLAALFAIPGLDMFRLIAERAARGVSPMSGDHEHLHHRLERAVGWRIGLPVYLALAGGPILLACSAPDMGVAGLIAAVSAYFAAWLATRRHRQPSVATPEGIGAARRAG